MAIAVLWSSPNRDGLTAAAKDKIAEGIASAGVSVTEIHLNRLKLEHCRACGGGWGTCQQSGTCILRDSFAEIYEQLKDAQGIVWVTAVYWHDLTECMKAFVDRLRRCETAHNHFLSGKECLLAACAGGSGLGSIQCLHNLEESLGHMRMTAADRIPVNQFNREYILPALAGAGQAFARRVGGGPSA